MKNNNIVNPIGLKGNEINDRMKELMGISPINENRTTSVVELTKIGPDGNVYAIVRENHSYYIKTTNKKSNILAEDFKYIGGLQNKNSEVYSSYAKAIKHLNFKFNSLAEAYNVNGNINVFKNDNLITECGMGGFSSNEKGQSGFSGMGNLDGQTMEPEQEYAPIAEYFLSEEIDSNEYEREYNDTEEDDDAEADRKIDYDEDEKDLTESEKAIMAMNEEEEDDEDNNFSKYKKGKPEQSKNPDYDKPLKDVDLKKNAYKPPTHKDSAYDKPIPKHLKENNLSIQRALLSMDEIIDNLAAGTLKKKVYSLK